ncbi:hypothetical protein GCM10009642_03590 [Nocardiopsis metallicus]
MQLIYDFGLRGPDGAWPNPLEANHAINCMDEERLPPEQGGELRVASYGQAPFMDPGVDVTEGPGTAASTGPPSPSSASPAPMTSRDCPTRSWSRSPATRPPRTVARSSSRRRSAARC